MFLKYRGTAYYLSSPSFDPCTAVLSAIALCYRSKVYLIPRNL
jgi:hypothetical protein